MFLNYSLALGIHGSGEIPGCLQNRIQLRNRFSADITGEDNTVAGIKPRECFTLSIQYNRGFFSGIRLRGYFFFSASVGSSAGFGCAGRRNIPMITDPTANSEIPMMA